MNAVRYYIALLLVVSLPGPFCIWFLVHPFVRFWRRMGSRAAYAIQAIVGCAIAYGLFRARHTLLAIDFGTNYWLLGFALPLIAVGVLMRKWVGQQLKFKMLVGLPEIAPDKYPKRLLTDGVYARVRHPRYAEVVITVLAWGLVANYLATYVLFAATCAWVLAVVHLEERELRDRFGTQWDEYAARVPRFLPNLHAPPKAASQSAKGQSA